jgi:hypothetical protein
VVVVRPVHSEVEKVLAKEKGWKGRCGHEEESQ